MTGLTHHLPRFSMETERPCWESSSDEFHQQQQNETEGRHEQDSTRPVQRRMCRLGQSTIEIKAGPPSLTCLDVMRSRLK